MRFKQFTIFILFIGLSIHQSTLANDFKPDVSILVSLSMPESSIKKWLHEASIIDAGVYLRGFKGNSMQETMQALTALKMDKEMAGLLVDPRIFQKYDITQVPAVIVEIGEKNHIFYGDTGLTYALSTIHRQIDEHHVALTTLLTLLRGENA